MYLWLSWNCGLCNESIMVLRNLSLFSPRFIFGRLALAYSKGENSVIRKNQFFVFCASATDWYGLFRVQQTLTVVFFKSLSLIRANGLKSLTPAVPGFISCSLRSILFSGASPCSLTTIRSKVDRRRPNRNPVDFQHFVRPRIRPRAKDCPPAEFSDVFYSVQIISAMLQYPDWGDTVNMTTRWSTSVP